MAKSKIIHDLPKEKTKITLTLKEYKEIQNELGASKVKDKIINYQKDNIKDLNEYIESLNNKTDSLEKNNSFILNKVSVLEKRNLK